MQGHREDDKGYVDGRQVMGEPSRQVNVGNGPAGITQALRERRQGAAEAVHDEDQGLPAHNCSSHGRPPAGLAAESGIEQIDHAGLDAEPGGCVEGFHRPKGGMTRFHAINTNTASGAVSEAFGIHGGIRICWNTWAALQIWRSRGPFGG